MTEKTNQNRFHSHLSSARSIVDLITTMANNSDSFDGLESRTLSAAGLTALEHLTEAEAAAEAEFKERQEAQS